MAQPIPVTLVTGFLGAGKTSLLHDFISRHEGGHLAVLVEKEGDLSIDAKSLRGLCGAMDRQHDVVEEINDEAQLAAVLREIATQGRHERVLMEVSGLTLSSYWERALANLSALAQLENTIVVVDLVDFSAGPASGRDDFLCAQIAAASLIVLNKCDLAGEVERTEATRRIRPLNASAKIIETAYGEVPSGELLRPGTRPAPASSAGAVALPPYENVVYRAQRPFHPQRFWDWFNAPHAGLVRVKGIIWLATRSLLVGGVSRAGVQNSCGAAGIWWAALPREEWPAEPEQLMEMQETWTEPYGDRRQELVLIGEQGRTADAARKLNLCLLSESEFALTANWTELTDPFPEWDLDDDLELNG